MYTVLRKGRDHLLSHGFLKEILKSHERPCKETVPGLGRSWFGTAVYKQRVTLPMVPVSKEGLASTAQSAGQCVVRRGALRAAAAVHTAATLPIPGHGNTALYIAPQ